MREALVAVTEHPDEARDIFISIAKQHFRNYNFEWYVDEMGCYAFRDTNINLLWCGYLMCERYINNSIKAVHNVRKGNL